MYFINTSEQLKKNLNDYYVTDEIMKPIIRNICDKLDKRNNNNKDNNNKNERNNNKNNNDKNNNDKNERNNNNNND